MSITINDVARKAKVSKTTISRYLNKQFSNMSEETRQRISVAIEELGYQPNIVARGLKRKRIQTIGVLVANILNPYSTEIVRGIEDVCKSWNFNMIVCNADDDPRKQQEYLEMLHAKHIDGFIIQPAEGNADGLMALYRNSVPLVLIDRRLPELKVDTVTVNNRLSSKRAIEYLIKLGHSRIALLTSPINNISSRQERFEGYLDALKNAGFKQKEEYVKILSPQSTAYQAVKELLTLNEPPTALFTINGRVTLETLMALKKLKVRVPTDLSLIGFDNPEWAEIVEPPVTTVAQPVYKLGVTAANLLLQHIQGKTRGGNKPKTIIFDTELIIRESCTLRQK